MITLITGGPGLGKTALSVKLLISQYPGRPIFSNIRGLTLEHTSLPKLEEWTREEFNDQGTSEHRFTFPPGAIVVIDECQQFFRPRASGSKVPPYVQAFETHRHQGIDFILVTQGSRLVDNNLRALVKGGLHIFLKSSYIGRFRHEKSEVIDEEDKSSIALASRRKYTLPKEVYPLYKSAEIHTKPPRAKLPLAAYLLLIAVVGGGGLAYQASHRISTAVHPDDNVALADHAAPGAAKPTTSGAMVASAVPARLNEALMPTDDQNPLSAPLYAAVVPPVVAPEIVGCISSRKACTCFSQQSTPVWLPPEQCRLRAAGKYFDPYRQPSERKTEQTSASRQGIEATTPGAIGGSSSSPPGAISSPLNAPPAGESQV